MGLNDYYASGRSNILMRSLLPFVNTAFNLVFQEESYRTLAFVNDKFSFAFIAKK